MERKPPDHKKLKELIKKCLKEDRRAQKDLYEFTYTRLSTRIALFTKDPSERDWVFNIGMLKVFRNLHKVKDVEGFLPWALTILIRTAIDDYRHKKKDRKHLNVLANDYEIQKSFDDDLNDALNRIKTEEVISIIQNLPDHERMVFTLHEIEEYSHPAIEKETGINQNTSKWLLAKARKSLREMVESSKFKKYYGYGR